jgi:hypothetical protein
MAHRRSHITKISFAKAVQVLQTFGLLGNVLLNVFEDTGIGRAEVIWARHNKTRGNGLLHHLRHGDWGIARKQTSIRRFE